MCWKVFKESGNKTESEGRMKEERFRGTGMRGRIDKSLYLVLIFAIFMGLVSPSNCIKKAPGDSLSLGTSTATAGSTSIREGGAFTPSQTTTASAKTTSTAVNAGIVDETSQLALNSLSYAESNAHAIDDSEANSEANSLAGSAGVALDNGKASADSTSSAKSKSLASDKGTANSIADSESIAASGAENSEVNTKSTSEVKANAVAGNWEFNAPNDGTVEAPADNFNYLGNPLDYIGKESSQVNQGNGPLLSDSKGYQQQVDTSGNDLVFSEWETVYMNRNPDNYYYNKIQPSSVVAEFENFQQSYSQINPDPTEELVALKLPDASVKQSLGSEGNISTVWKYADLVAVDVGVSSQGDLYAAGVDGNLYEYDMLANKWERINGDFELRNILRVDVNYDGTPYVVTACGDTYYLNCERKWEKLPGCARDIGIGMGGEIFKIGCERRSGGYRIYRLNCKYDCKKCSKQGCMRYRKKCDTCYTFEPANDRKCKWFNMDGGGVRISVHNNGHPFIINEYGVILYYDGTDWINIPNTRAIDLSVSNDGVVFYVGSDYGVYSLSPAKYAYDYTYVNFYHLLGQSAIAVTSGPYSRPVIIGNEYKVYTSYSLLGLDL